MSWFILSFGIFCALFGAVATMVFTTELLPSRRHALRRRRLWSRAYKSAFASTVRWGFMPEQCDTWGRAFADRFVERIGECGIDEAEKEFEAWEREADATNALIRTPPDPGVVEAIEEELEAKFGGKVVSLRARGVKP